jgi:hypothetical protein
VVILSNGNRVGVKDGERAVELLHAIKLHLTPAAHGKGYLPANPPMGRRRGRYAPKPPKKGKK